MAKRGRKRLSEDEKRCAPLLIYLTKQEHTWLLMQANNVSAYVRDRIFGKEFIKYMVAIGKGE